MHTYVNEDICEGNILSDEMIKILDFKDYEL